MKWYRNNNILGSILILVFMIVIYFGCKIVKAIGPVMGKETKEVSSEIQ